MRDRNWPARRSIRARERSIWTILTALALFQSAAGVRAWRGYERRRASTTSAPFIGRRHSRSPTNRSPGSAALFIGDHSAAAYLAGALPWVHDPIAYRFTCLVLGIAALAAFGIAVQRRFQRIWPDYAMAGLAAAAVALSPGFRSAMFWGDTDALPLLFSALVCLLLHDLAHRNMAGSCLGRAGDRRQPARRRCVLHAGNSMFSCPSCHFGFCGRDGRARASFCSAFSAQPPSLPCIFSGCGED